MKLTTESPSASERVCKGAVIASFAINFEMIAATHAL
jgi:hypothetical protein